MSNLDREALVVDEHPVAVKNDQFNPAVTRRDPTA
jgi:hypothetical protein